MKRKSRIPVARLNVTREAVELFCFVEDCIETGDDKFWEPEGGRKRQYLDGDRALRRMFGLYLGDISPCDHELRLDPRMPDYMKNLCSRDSWPVALSVRRELLKAVTKK